MEQVAVTDSFKPLLQIVGRAVEVHVTFDSALAGSAGVAAISAEGAVRELAEALKSSQTLRSVTLENFPEAVIVGAAGVLPECRSVRSLSVLALSNPLGDAAGVALMKALGETVALESFALHALNSRFTAATVEAVRRAFGGGAAGPDAETTAAVAAPLSPALRHLKFGVCNSKTVGDDLGVAVAQAVERCKTLESVTVDLSRTQIGDATGMALAACAARHSGLTAFTFLAARTQMSGGSGEAIGRALSASSSIRSFTLGFGDTAIGRETYAAVGAALEANERLEAAALQMQGVPFTTREGAVLARALRRSRGLRSFELRADRAPGFDNAALTALSGGLGANAPSAPLERLAIRAQGAAFGNAGASSLVAGVARCQALRDFEFDAEGTHIGNRTGLALAEAMRRSPCLRRLRVCCAGSSVGDAFCTAVAAAASEECTRLEAFSLDVANTKVGDEGGQALAAVVARGQELRSFVANMSCTKVGDETAVAMAAALEESPLLEIFNLRAPRTALADAGTSALVTAAAQRRGRGRALRALTLDVAQTQVSDVTANAVVAAVAQSATLREFVFQASPSQFSSAAVESMLDAVRRNVALESLHLFVGDRRCASYVARNREARKTSSVLASLAKPDLAPAPTGLKNQFLQNTLLRYYLPEDFTVLPPEFVHINSAIFQHP